MSLPVSQIRDRSYLILYSFFRSTIRHPCPWWLSLSAVACSPSWPSAPASSSGSPSRGTWRWRRPTLTSARRMSSWSTKRSGRGCATPWSTPLAARATMCLTCLRCLHEVCSLPSEYITEASHNLSTRKLKLFIHPC